METEFILKDLKYAEEHLSCKNYMTNVSTGFHYEELSIHAIESDRLLKANTVIFLLEGRCELSYDHYLNRVFKGGEMLFIPKAALLSGRVLEPVRLIYFSFQNLLNPCDKLQLQYLSAYQHKMVYDFQPLPFHEPMLRFVESLTDYLKNGVSCVHLHELKHQEFFLILRFFYTKEEMATLFYPILAHSFDLKNWVLDHYTHYQKLDDLIQASSMSRTSFMKQFKEEFGMPPYQWMIRQVCQKLVQKASQPSVTVKELMEVAHIEDASQFARFCHREFQCTPRELIAHYQQEMP